MARRSVRSAFGTCPSTAQRFATHQALYSTLQGSFSFDRGYRFYCGDQKNLVERLFTLQRLDWARFRHCSLGTVFFTHNILAKM